MSIFDINDFNKEIDCCFENERYSVRDNGAVLRHPREGKRPRANDNQWTLGIENKQNGYLHLSSVRIHRIVATAFHGAPPDPKYVVDHIDSNRKNNRPENLRWLTRLENTLLNSVTRKKIEYLCGSIEAFLENPLILNYRQLEPNYSWMRSVTKEEAQNCKDRMAIWANSERKTYSASNGVKYRSSFEKRIYKPINKFDAGFGREPGLDITKTLWCATYMFDPNHFPLCPESFKNDRLEEYYQNIKSGEVFAVTDKIEEHPEFYFSLTALKAAIQREKQAIIVLCEKSDKFLVVGIELYAKNKWFIHYNLGKEEAELAYIEKQNVPVKEFYNLGYRNAYK